MALETVTLNPGVGGEDIAVDTVGSAQVPVSKILLGADGADGGLVSSANPLPVSDAGDSLTVDGSVSVSNFPATQPVSAAALPLPSGAATEAKQPALGTAGTPSTDVLSVQGVSGGTALPVSDNGGSLTVDGSVSVSGSVTANAGTNLNTSALALESGGNLAAVNTATGAQSDAEATGDGSIIAILKRLRALLSGTLTVAGTVTANVTNATLAAGTALIGTVAAALRTDALMSGTTAITPKFASINASSSGDNTLVSAVVGKKIRVLKYRIIPASDVAVRWYSGAAGTALTGSMSLAGKAGDSGAEAIFGHFETASNTALVLNLGSAVQVSGYVVYAEV